MRYYNENNWSMKYHQSGYTFKINKDGSTTVTSQILINPFLAFNITKSYHFLADSVSTHPSMSLQSFCKTTKGYSIIENSTNSGLYN